MTRSLLGWGFVAGIFYLVVGLALALTRDGFDLTRHPLSLLMLGEAGWVQRANLILTGAMVLAAAAGFARAMRASGRIPPAAIMLAVFGGALVASAIFPPDPMAGFPPGADGVEGSSSGLLHLAFGAIGFVSLAVAAFLVGGWFVQTGRSMIGVYSRLSAIVIVVGFAGGAAFSTSALGVLALWLAVVAGWLWLAIASIELYRTVPHPDADRRRLHHQGAPQGGR